MSDIRELYQETILDHGRSPRNFHEMPDATCRAVGHNPLCGDRLTLFARVRDGKIEEVSFVGAGCAISQASASLLTEAVAGRSADEARELGKKFIEMVTGEPGQIPDVDRLDKLAVFSGVCEFPVRVKCASLAWHTLEAALDGQDEPVSTE